MNYKNREKLIAHSIFLLGSLIVLYPFVSILFLALSEPGKRVSGFTVHQEYILIILSKLGREEDLIMHYLILSSLLLALYLLQ